MALGDWARRGRSWWRRVMWGGEEVVGEGGATVERVRLLDEASMLPELTAEVLRRWRSQTGRGPEAIACAALVVLAPTEDGVEVQVVGSFMRSLAMGGAVSLRRGAALVREWAMRVEGRASEARAAGEEVGH